MRGSIPARVDRLDWDSIAGALDERGHATTPALLSPAECASLARLFDDDRRFRSTVDMARYRFGVGCYRYFAVPLPPVVAALREHAYRRLAPIANRWMEALGAGERYPADLAEFLAHCAARGQRRPTPLLLHYTAGGYNCLHQDLYGAVAFPLQLTILLSRPGDFSGGEILLVEQRPRAQSRGEVVVLRQGEAVVFPTRWRPVAGSRGHYYRGTVRHGVSRLRSGERTTLGVIFHDAE